MEYFLGGGQGPQSLFIKESGSLPSFTFQPENNFLKQLSGFFGRRQTDLPANTTFLQSTQVITGCASRRKFNSCVAPKICNQEHGRASRRKTQPSWRAHKQRSTTVSALRRPREIIIPHWAKNQLLIFLSLRFF